MTDQREAAAAAQQLRHSAAALRARAERLLAVAPDAGTGPAAGPVLDVQAAAVRALLRQADELTATAEQLAVAADRAGVVEVDLTRRVLRLARPGEGAGGPADGA